MPSIRLYDTASRQYYDMEIEQIPNCDTWRYARNAVQMTAANGDPIYEPTVFMPIDNLAVTTAQDIWTPQAGKKFRLMGCALGVTAAAGPIKIYDGNVAAASLIAVLPLLSIGAQISLSFSNGYLSKAANNRLKVIGASLQIVHGVIWGTEQ